MRLFPELPGDTERLDLKFFPPGPFISRLMQLPMMSTAEGHRELIADFKADRPWLRKTQMMRIRGLPAADQTRL